MSITGDPGLDVLISQSMAMQQGTARIAAQIKVAKGIHSSQEHAIMTLISSVGLTTYDQNGVVHSVQPVGTHVSVDA